MSDHFGSGRVVSLGRVHDTGVLPGLVALVAGEPVSFLLYAVRDEDCEIVALVSVLPCRDVARSLVDSLTDRCAGLGVKRIVLVMTNDNLSAQAFYAACGFLLVATHAGAADRARALKPEIPHVGEDGVPISDELEYERPLMHT